MARPEKKNRIPIEPDQAARIMYEQDNTCCVCNIRGRPVQIHHIDDDPSNNDDANLAVLCLICHDETQTSGGFGRKLNAPLVTTYRDNWIDRVASRRTEADKIAATAMSGTSAAAFGTDSKLHETSDVLEPQVFERQNEDELVRYVNELPSVLEQAYRFSKERRASGITVEMNSGGAEIADVLEQILLNLAYWFPPHHFGERPAPEYFNTYVANLYIWHRALAEPYGEGTGGTMIGQVILGGVVSDLENAVESMVYALFWTPDSPVDLQKWRKNWKKAQAEGPSFGLIVLQLRLKLTLAWYALCQAFKR